MDGLTGTKGGSGVWQRIISEMPEHDVYIEAFWGRGTIARKKRPARYTIGIDMDPAAITNGTGSALMFRADGIQWLTDYCLPARLPLPDDSATVARAAELSDGGPTPDCTPGTAATLGVEDHAAESRVPAGSRAACTFGGVAWYRHFVYLDPPYLGCRGYYRHELTEQQHRVLCRLFRRLPCPAALSGYRSNLYAAELRGIRSIVIPTVNRAGRRVDEIVWLNYDKPRRYHDVRFIGSGRRERERIRRRMKSWSEGLARMKPPERQAVFEACAAAYRVAAGEGADLSGPRGLIANQRGRAGS